MAKYPVASGEIVLDQPLIDCRFDFGAMLMASTVDMVNA